MTGKPESLGWAGTSAYASLRNYSGGQPPREGERRLVAQTFASWNQIGPWLRTVATLTTASVR